MHRRDEKNSGKESQRPVKIADDQKLIVKHDFFTKSQIAPK
jgi:hypothetical protein